jgi:predicted transcriptional regulator
MLEPKEVTMEVVRLANGRFGVREIGAGTIDAIAGEFATEREADAWVLRRSMLSDEANFETDIIKPGGGQGVA